MSEHSTRDNSGSFSANKRKEKDTHPDIKGKATIGGVDYWVSGWRKQNDNGVWYSLAFDVRDAAQSKPAPATSGAAIDDEIPF